VSVYCLFDSGLIGILIFVCLPAFIKTPSDTCLFAWFFTGLASGAAFIISLVLLNFGVQ